MKRKEPFDKVCSELWVGDPVSVSIGIINGDSPLGIIVYCVPDFIKNKKVLLISCQSGRR